MLPSILFLFRNIGRSYELLSTDGALGAGGSSDRPTEFWPGIESEEVQTDLPRANASGKKRANYQNRKCMQGIH